MTKSNNHTGARPAPCSRFDEPTQLIDYSEFLKSVRGDSQVSTSEETVDTKTQKVAPTLAEQLEALPPEPDQTPLHRPRAYRAYREVKGNSFERVQASLRGREVLAEALKERGVPSEQREALRQRFELLLFHLGL